MIKTLMIIIKISNKSIFLATLIINRNFKNKIKIKTHKVIFN